MLQICLVLFYFFLCLVICFLFLCFSRQFEAWNRKINIAECEQLRASNNPPRRLDCLYQGFETTGYIRKFFEDRGFGFICADGIEDRVFFHRDHLMPGVIPTVHRRVRFRLEKNNEGYIAKDINSVETFGGMF